MWDSPIWKVTKELVKLVLGEKLGWALISFSAIFWFLTHDSTVWLVFALAETCYLSFSLGNGPLPKLLRHLRWQAIIWPLFPLLTILLQIRADKIYISGMEFSGPYDRWEIMALTWNLLFFFMSFLFMPKLPNVVIEKIILFALLGGGIHLTWQAFVALGDNNYSRHLWCVFGIVWCEIFAAACFVISDLVTDGKLHEDGKCCLKTLLFVSLPTALAVGFLLLFTHHYSGLEDPRDLSIFLSGAIAFQFVASSLVFALIESGAYDALVIFLPKTHKVFKRDPGIADPPQQAVSGATAT